MTMEIKEWSYEEFPALTEEVEGAETMHTDGSELGVRYIKDVEYAKIGDVTLHLQILYPFTRNDPEMECPCIVYVQGSGWAKQDVYHNLPSLAKLAERGYIVAVVEYRHADLAVFPAPIQDARNAVRYLRSHAEEYHIRPDQMILGGSSSGGHTAVYAAILQDDGTEADLYPGVSAEVCGIVDYYGAVSAMRDDAFPSTLDTMTETSPEGKETGVSLRENPEMRRKFSVDCQITPETDLPPVLILHGTKDRTVNALQSVDLYRKLKECGKQAELVLLDGADHGGAEFWTPAVLDRVEKFLHEVLPE